MSSTTRAAVQVHLPSLQSRSPLHISECLMSLQSARPEQEQVEVVPGLPDPHLKLHAVLPKEMRNDSETRQTISLCVLVITGSIQRTGVLARLPEPAAAINPQPKD